jgi:flagellar basal-body rod protein FlgB
MLGFRADRHKLITANIANIDTPDYSPAELTFKNSLAAEMGKGKMKLFRTDKNHLPAAPGTAADYQVTHPTEKVELDTEMANLAENQLMYNLTVELLTRKFKGVENVLREAR